MNALRAIPAGILAGAAAVLGGASRLAEYGARRLAPPSKQPPRDPLADEPAADDWRPAPTEVASVPGPGADMAVDVDLVTETVTPPQPDETRIAADLPSADESIIDPEGPSMSRDPSQLEGPSMSRDPSQPEGGEARTYESHIAELADQNVSAVVRGIQDLSTEELGQLFDYESAHRKRKTVLQAIERAAAPEEGAEPVT